MKKIKLSKKEQLAIIAAALFIWFPIIPALALFFAVPLSFLKTAYDTFMHIVRGGYSFSPSGVVHVIFDLIGCAACVVIGLVFAGGIIVCIVVCAKETWG